jgi:dihydrofolate synthase/folylpolyglutamate synthase
VTDPENLHIISRSLSGQVFSYRGIRDIHLNMLGEYQVRNAMAAIDIALLMRKQGVSISDEVIRQGLSQARWPGRFELLSHDPVVIVDGAHNPDGVNALTGSIETFLPDTKINFVMGVMKDKDYHTMLRLISPYAESFTTELPYSARGLDPEVLKKEISEYFDGPVQTASSVTDAVDKALAQARKNDLPVICFGSLYQVSDIRKYF